MDYAGHFAEEFRVVEPTSIACREVWRLLYSPQGEEKMEIGTELEVVGDSYHGHNSEGGELARNAELNELYDDEVGLKVCASTSERT